MNLRDIVPAEISMGEAWGRGLAAVLGMCLVGYTLGSGMTVHNIAARRAAQVGHGFDAQDQPSLIVKICASA